MAVSALSSLSSLTNSSSSSSSSAASSQNTVSSAANAQANLTQTQFLQLLTAQLQNQDPLNPVSDTDFASELAQFSTVSGIEQLNTNSQQMLQLQQLTQGAALVGQTVSYGGTAANASTGVVTAIALQNGQLTLQIGGQSVPSSQVQGILSSTSS